MSQSCPLLTFTRRSAGSGSDRNRFPGDRYGFLEPLLAFWNLCWPSRPPSWELGPSLFSPCQFAIVYFAPKSFFKSQRTILCLSPDVASRELSSAIANAPTTRRYLQISA